MKKHYLLTGIFQIALLSYCRLSFAQHVEFLNANNVYAGIGIGGNLFTKIDSSEDQWGLFEVPRGSGISSIFTSSIWMSAIDRNGQLHCAAQSLKAVVPMFTIPDFYNGPVATNYTSAYDMFFNRVFKITRSQIIHHQSLGNVIDPSQIDSAILLWPAMGNPIVNARYAVNIETPLAPFVDINSNGIYDPREGDYPAICGDEAIFFVFNDDRGIHHQSNGQKLGVEVRGLAQAYAYGNSAVDNTVFVSYEIQNKSLNDYSGFYLSLFEDPDLGCFSNDRIGCDSAAKIMFTYNNDSIEADCNGTKGYGNLRAATGVKFLRGGFSSFNIAGRAIPYDSTGYRNFQTTTCSNGLPFGDDSTGCGGNPYRYYFPGNPAQPGEWTDISSSPVGGDRRIAGTSDSAGFLSGETKRFDYAFFTTYDSTATNITIVDSLKRDAEEIQTFYTLNLLNCSPFISGLSNQPAQGLNLSVYPNPANTMLTLMAADIINEVTITDMAGRSLFSVKPNSTKTSLDVSSFATGIYLLQVKADGKIAVRKITIE